MRLRWYSSSEIRPLSRRRQQRPLKLRSQAHLRVAPQPNDGITEHRLGAQQLGDQRREPLKPHAEQAIKLDDPIGGKRHGQYAHPLGAVGQRQPDAHHVVAQVLGQHLADVM